MTDPMTHDRLQQFVAAWFHALDVHAPAQECLTYLAADGLRMHFPERDIHGTAPFLRWYEGVVNVFFDEEHTIRHLDVVSRDANSANLTLRVRWQSGFWQRPEPASKRIDLEVSQTWVVRRSPPGKNAFDIEIVEYVVSGDLAYAPGSATLPAASHTAVDDLIELNHRMADMEQHGGDAAREFFAPLLSDQLLFRRAGGKTVGKSGDDGYLVGLAKNPFTSRRSEDIAVAEIGDRVLVTLIVVATSANDGSVHRYRNIRLFERRANTWTLEFWYNYEITGL
jgi:ketosteroid isomerase-like protein